MFCLQCKLIEFTIPNISPICIPKSFEPVFKTSILVQITLWIILAFSRERKHFRNIQNTGSKQVPIYWLDSYVLVFLHSWHLVPNFVLQKKHFIFYVFVLNSWRLFCNHNKIKLVLNASIRAFWVTIYILSTFHFLLVICNYLKFNITKKCGTNNFCSILCWVIVCRLVSSSFCIIIPIII